MGYYDEFPGENIAPAGSFATDPEKQEEEIDEVLEQQQPQEEVQAPVAEEAPVEEEASPEQNLFQQATDFAAEALGLRSQEESQELRKEGQEEVAEAQEGIEEAGDVGTVVARETTRAVAGGVAGVIEQPVRFAQQVVGQDASFNLGIAENKTAVGEFARSTITMLGMIRNIGRVAPGLSGGTTAASRLAQETAKGAIADFIMEEGDGNMSNLLEGMNPDLKDTWITALAHDDDDNIYIRKLKNMAEGGVFGVAVDGIGELYGALRAGKKVAAAGGSKEEVGKAVQEYMEQAELELNVPTRPIQEQVDEAMDSAFQYELDIDSVSGEVRQHGILIEQPNASIFEPGLQRRVDEGAANNADSVETNLYEPNERAAVTSGTTPTQGAQSIIDAGDTSNARRIATDETFRKILSAPESIGAEGALQLVVKAIGDNLDVDAIYEGLKGDKANWVAESVPVIREFLEASREANDFRPLGALLEQADGQVIKQYLTDEGALAVRVLAKDTANQLSDIAKQIQDVDAIGGDSFRQAEMLLDRMETLSKMNIEASYKAGFGLAARKTNKMNIKKLLGMEDGDQALKQAQSDEAITKLREALEKGDPAAKQEFSTLADAIALVDGNPEKIMSFWDKWWTVGAQGLRSAMYNGFLSTTTSQLRNLTGNAFNTTLRPATQAIGFTVQGDMTNARIQLAAYHGITENLQEAFKVFKTSFAESDVDSSQAVRWEDGAFGTGRELVENMKASAKTDGERTAAQIVDIYYSMMNMPWFRMPTRGLSAVDDAVRTLVARMELKKDAMQNSFEKGQGFKVDPDRYAKLVDMKIDGQGNILDQHLLDTAKQVTFQEDISGFGKSLQELSNRSPIVKLMFPFIKTPINIMRQTASYVPRLGRFTGDYARAMEGNDEALKALYKGREALGFITLGSAVGLAASGQLTGKGPVDRQKQELWLKTHQPNSIKIPGVGWVSYETVEPLNTLFSAAADLTQIAIAGNDSLYDKGFAQISYTIAAATLDKSYFKGMIEAAELMNVSDSRWLNLVQNKVATTGNSLALPWSGARAQLNKLMQPGKQDFDNMWQRELQKASGGVARIYGVDRVDILEDKPMQFGDHFTNIWNTLTPFDVTNSDPESVAAQLGELGVDITLQFSDTFKGIELNATERQQLNQYLADTGIGKKLKNLLGREDFNKEVKAWKESNLSQDPPPRWLDRIHQELNRAKRQARAQMLADNPTFADKVDLNTVTRAAIKRGRYEQGQQLQQQLETLLDY